MLKRKVQADPFLVAPLLWLSLALRKAVYCYRKALARMLVRLAESRSRRACTLRMWQPLICAVPMKADNRPPQDQGPSIIPASKCKILLERCSLQLSHTAALHFQCYQLASRQAVIGIRPSSAPSCSRTGLRSPSIASRKTDRANSSGFTVVLPIDLSVSQASSNAASNTTSVGGSKQLLWKPRIAPPSVLRTIRAITEGLAQSSPSL